MRHLLAHTAGLPPFRPYYTWAAGREAVLAEALAEPLVRPPGTRTVYSDIGYMILAAVVEAVTGEEFSAFCRERIFAPLGMGDTRFNPPPSLRPRIAATEYRADLGRVMWGEVHDENALAMGGVSGHAGLFSTAADLGAFGAMMRDGGAHGGARVLSAAAVREMTRLHTAGLGEARGLGWSVRPDERSSGGDLLSPRAFGHTGFTGTSVWVDPELDLVCVLLTNRIHPSRDNDAIIRFRPRFHNAVAAAVAGEEA